MSLINKTVLLTIISFLLFFADLVINSSLSVPFFLSLPSLFFILTIYDLSFSVIAMLIGLISLEFFIFDGGLGLIIPLLILIYRFGHYLRKLIAIKFIIPIVLLMVFILGKLILIDSLLLSLPLSVSYTARLFYVNLVLILALMLFFRTNYFLKKLK